RKSSRNLRAEQDVSSSSTERRQLVTFGVTMAAAFALLTALRVWRRGFDKAAMSLMIVAGLFALAALIVPAALGPVYRWWMRLAEILGWINTRILLVLIFFLIVTPL